MDNLFNTQVQMALAPIDANGGAVTPLAIDTLGFNALSILILVGNLAADMTALKLQECETSAGSYTDVTGGAFVAFPLAATGDGKIWRFNVKLAGARKRFYKVAGTAGAGASLIGMVAILGRANNLVPNTAAGSGCFEAPVNL